MGRVQVIGWRAGQTFAGWWGDWVSSNSSRGSTAQVPGRLAGRVVSGFQCAEFLNWARIYQISHRMSGVRIYVQKFASHAWFGKGPVAWERRFCGGCPPGQPASHPSGTLLFGTGTTRLSTSARLSAVKRAEASAESDGSEVVAEICMSEPWGPP